MSLEFIEMVSLISNDCTVTSCIDVWLLNLFGPVHFKDIQCKSRSSQNGMHAPIETRSERNYATTNVHKRTFKRIKFDNQGDLTPFECISEMVLVLSF